MIQRAALPPGAPVTAGSPGGFYAGAVSLTLPYPPTVNTYWRRHGNRYFISKAGTSFKKAVQAECASVRGLRCLAGRLAVTVGLNPPDRRKRDVDNIFKAIGDSLVGIVYADDSQIDRLLIVRGGVRPPGQCTVLIEEIS